LPVATVEEARGGTEPMDINPWIVSDFYKIVFAALLRSFDQFVQK